MLEIAKNTKVYPVINKFVNDDYQAESSLTRGRCLADTMDDGLDDEISRLIKKSFDDRNIKS